MISKCRILYKAINNIIIAALFSPFLLHAQLLEIHYINVGQGGSTLLIGPNGTRLLYDFGNKNGNEIIVPYLIGLGWDNSKHLHYTILSHRDRDHYYGYKGLVEGGINVLIANYGPLASDKGSKSVRENWMTPALKTKAGAVQEIKPGFRLSLGDGAELLVAASNGHILDGKVLKVRNENDRSVALFIKYGEFEYILDGDLGGGTEECSRHQTTQIDIQTEVARALISLKELDQSKGVDVLHVAHHGSESSSPARYLKLMKPEVGVISVGNPNCSYQHPRKNVIATLKRINHSSSTTPSSDCSAFNSLVHVLQTDRGSENCSEDSLIGLTDNSSIIGGDIIITTNGKENYTIRTSGMTWKGIKRYKTEEERIITIQLD